MWILFLIIPFLMFGFFKGLLAILIISALVDGNRAQREGSEKK